MAESYLERHKSRSNQLNQRQKRGFIMNFEQEIEIIVTDKQTAFLRATPEETTQKFPQPKFKALWKVLKCHLEAVMKVLQVC